MDDWLDFARGPFFRLTFAVMVLGLARSVIMTVWGVVRARQLTADKRFSWPKIATQTIDWIVPVRHMRHRWPYSALSMLFHVGAIVTPVFLFAHIRLVQQSTGVSWWALPMGVVDVLTLITIAAIFALLVARLSGSASRALSRPQDYIIPILLAIPFISGYLAAHPYTNPFPYNATMLVHMLSAGVCFLVVPFTKLAHVALLPLTRLPSDLAWRFPDSYPEAVARQIGKEGQPI
jgi:nitrate reductase gamma subunit